MLCRHSADPRRFEMYQAPLQPERPSVIRSCKTVQQPRGRTSPAPSVALSLVIMIAAAACMRPTTITALPDLGVELATTATQPPATLPDGPLTLAQASAIALQNNPDLAAGVWDIEAARARKRQAAGGNWPSLVMTAAYRHHWHPERLVPARAANTAVAFSNDLLAGDLVLTIPIFTGNRIANSIAANEALIKAAEQRLVGSRAELLFQVRSTFYAILGHARLLEALEHSKHTLKEHRRRTEELIAARKAARLDLLNTEVRIAEIDHLLVKQRGVYDLSKRLLTSLLGVEALPSGGLRLQGSLEFRRDTLDQPQLLATALDARADMAEMTASLEAQARRIDIARAEYWPLVSAKGTYGARASAQGDYDDLGFAGIELFLPIFTGPGTAARIDEERAVLAALAAKRKSLARVIRRDVELAIIQVQTATARVEATERVIIKAKESLAITEEKTRLGSGTTMDVLDAQAALLGAETTYFSALVDLHTSFALLDLATGGPS